MKETDPLVKPKGYTKEEVHELVRHNLDVGKAAFLIRDVITQGGAVDSNFTYNPYEGNNSAITILISIVCRKILSKKIVHKAIHTIGWILVLLSFVEDPLWCRGLEGGCSSTMSLHGSPAFGDGTDVPYYPNFGLNLLSPEQSFVAELICSILLLLYVLLLMGRDGLDISKFLNGTYVSNYRIVFFLCVIFQFVGLAFFGGKGYYSFCSLYIRLIILVSLNGNIQRELSHFIELIPKLWNFLFLLLLVIIFYAWIGNTMFLGSEEGQQNFPTLVEGMFSLWISFTTANYPDVMMPAYNKNSFTNAFFVTYMIIAYFLVLNVIMSQVMNSYTNSEQNYDKINEEKNKQKMLDAYDLLDPSGVGSIDRKDFLAIFAVLNIDCPEVRFFSPDEVTIFFALLKHDNSNTLTKDEFLRSTNVMLLEFQKVEKSVLFVQRLCPGLYNSQGYQSFSGAISSDRFELIIDVIVFLNAILVFVQSYPQLTGQVADIDEKYMDKNFDTLWELGETIFTIIYCIEMFCKLVVFGWKKYVSEYRNLFDGTITILALAATMYVYYPNQFSNTLLIRYVVMTRVLRLGRLLIAIPQFSLAGRVFLKLIPRGIRVAKLLFSFMYLFSAFALQRYGGLITRDPSNSIAFTLEGTGFAGAGYWANSFNDMMSGMNVMFNLLVINNWTNEVDGIVAVSGTRLSRYFFISFHLIGVLILNNIVLSLVMDIFFNEYEKIKNGDETTASEATFDPSVITGTKTNLVGEYKVMGSTGSVRKSMIQKLTSPV